METQVTRKVAYDLIKRRAEQERADGDSPQQAVAKFMQTPDGRALYDAYKALPPDVVPIRKAAEPTEAQAEILAKAEEIRKANPRLSPHQARARAYQETPGLLQKALAETRGGYDDGPEAA